MNASSLVTGFQESIRGTFAVWKAYSSPALRRPLSIGLIAGMTFGSIIEMSADEAADRVSVLQVPASGKAAKAVLEGQSTVHLLFDQDDGPYYARSEDEGLAFQTPISIVDPATQQPGRRFEAADLAVGRDGRIHVAMGNNAWKLKLPQEEWSLHYAVLAPGSRKFSPVRNLNRKPSEGFSLAADEHGKVTACFLSGKLFAMVSQNDGESFSGAAELNPSWDPCNCCTTSAAYGADGKLAVLYREETKSERDMYVALWDQGPMTSLSRARVSITPWKLDACPMTYFTINRTETGYVAVWPTKTQVYFARLDKDGKLLAPGEIQTPGTSGMRMGLLALCAKDGSTLIAWKDKQVLGWQLYDAQAQPSGKPSSAPSPGNGVAGVALPNGKFVLFL